jgi:hypothetical protein
MSQFAAPAAASGIEWSELNGSLLIVEPREVVKDINTVHGVTDAVRADVTVLDGDQAGKKYDDTLIFPKVLQSQLASRIGQKVLGRLGQGQAKPSQNPPWMITPATPEDEQKAIAYLSTSPFTAADIV